MPFTLAHTMCDQDPQKLNDRVAEFCKDKPEAVAQFNTTTIVVGVKPVSGLIVGNGQQGGVPIFAVVTSVLISWPGSKEQKEQWEIDRIELSKKQMA